MDLYRRHGLAFAWQCALLNTSVLLAYPAIASSHGPAPTTEADSWIQSWIGNRSKNPNKELGGEFDLRRFRDPTYVLLTPIFWKPSEPLQPDAVHVPRGFVTDFASVPRPFWTLFRPDGDYAFAAVLHDYLYWTQDRPRVAADEVFRLAMEDLRISRSQASILFSAVEQFGSASWNANRAARERGEKRVLSSFPKDPAITWEEWRKDPNAFGSN